MALIALTRVQISLILEWVIECHFVWKLVLNINRLDFSFETNLIQKYIQSYQTVTAIDASRVLPINSNLHVFILVITWLGMQLRINCTSKI